MTYNFLEEKNTIINENENKKLANSIIDISVSSYCQTFLEDFNEKYFIEEMNSHRDIDGLKLAAIFNYLIRNGNIDETYKEIGVKEVIRNIIKHDNFNIDYIFLRDFGVESIVDICINHNRFWILHDMIDYIYKKESENHERYSIDECDSNERILKGISLLFNENIPNVLNILYRHHQNKTLIYGAKMTHDVYYVLLYLLGKHNNKYYNEIKQLLNNIFDGFPYHHLCKQGYCGSPINRMLLLSQNIYGENVFLDFLSNNNKEVNKIFIDKVKCMASYQQDSFYTDELKDYNGNNILTCFLKYDTRFFYDVIPLSEETSILFFEKNREKDNIITSLSHKMENVDIILITYLMAFLPLSPERMKIYKYHLSKSKVRDHALFKDLMKLTMSSGFGIKIFDKKDIEVIKNKYDNAFLNEHLNDFLSFISRNIKRVDRVHLSYYEIKEQEKNNVKTVSQEESDEKESFYIYNEEDIESLKESGSTKEPNSIYKIWENKIALSTGKKILAKNEKIKEELDNLKACFPNFYNYIEYVEDNIYLNDISRGYFYLPPSLLLSEPGIGKTFFLSELANKIGTFYDLINMESIGAGFSLVGGSSMYRDSDVGRIFKNMYLSSYANPIMILDEIDKTNKSSGSPVDSVLLPLLEEHTAKNFRDEFIQMRCDISKVSWIATANDINTISEPIKSRFEIFNISSPNFNERKILAQNIYKKVLNDVKCDHHFSSILSDEILDYIANDDKSSRTMRKDLTKALAKAAKNNRKEIIIEDITLTSNKKFVGF